MTSTAHGTALPEEVVKLQDAIRILQGAARDMKSRKSLSSQLSNQAADLENAVRTSCARASLSSIPLFALPILDLATKAYLQCANEMRKFRSRNRFLRSDVKPVIEDCIAATSVISDMLQIQGGGSLLIESDVQPTLPAPSGWRQQTSELGVAHIYVPQAIWDSFKFLLLGTANATDGAIIAMGVVPLTVKAMSQTILQCLTRWDEFRAVEGRIRELHQTIEAWIHLLHSKYVPDSNNDRLYGYVKDFLRVLLRAVVRLYLLRQTNRVKLFLAVGPVNEIIVGEIQAVKGELENLKLVALLSAHAAVRDARIEVAAVKNFVGDVGNQLQTVDTHIQTLGGSVHGQVQAVDNRLQSVGKAFEDNAASVSRQLQDTQPAMESFQLLFRGTKGVENAS